MKLDKYTQGTIGITLTFHCTTHQFSNTLYQSYTRITSEICLELPNPVAH